MELGNAIDYLIAQGVTVVSASWVFSGSFRGDGQGTIDDMVTNARAAGIFWAAAAGNQAQMHWSNYFNDTDANGWHNYTSADEGNTIVAQEGQNIDVYLTWDRWPTTDQNYDVYLYRSSDNVLVASSASTQNGTQAPSESFRYTVPAGQGGNYWIGIYNRSSAGDARFQLLCFQYFLQYQTADGSLGGQPADAASAMTVGAIPYNSTTLEDFSSRGPTIDGRVKPDIVAPDKVSTATYGLRVFWELKDATYELLSQGAYRPIRPRTFRITQNNATDLYPRQDYWFGSGSLHLGTAPPDTAAPRLTMSSRQVQFPATVVSAPPSATRNQPVASYRVSTLDGGALTGCTVSKPALAAPLPASPGSAHDRRFRGR